MTMQSAWTPVQSAGAAPVHGAPVQEAEDPAPSPAPTIPEGGSAVKTPLSQALATAEAQALPANTPAEAGETPSLLDSASQWPLACPLRVVSCWAPAECLLPAASYTVRHS